MTCFIYIHLLKFLPNYLHRGSKLHLLHGKAGIYKGFMNHSLCTYGATTLFHAEVPEKLIQQRIGHCSVEALHKYEHISQSQLLDASNIRSHDSKLPSNSACQ